MTDDATPPPITEDLERSMRAREGFVMELGRALHAAGTPAHRLEHTLQLLSDRLRLTAQFFCTPTTLLAGFGPPERQRVALERVEPGDVNLERLVDIDELASDVSAGRMNITDAHARLRGITRRADRYPVWLAVLAFAFASGSAAVFFRGSMDDVGAALLTGLVIGLICVVAPSRPNLARLTDFLCGFVAAAGAFAIAAFDPRVSPLTVTLSGLIVLVPGLTLTLSVNELTMRQLSSGTARFMHALTILVALGFGVAMGRAIGSQLLPGDASGPAAPGWMLAPALCIAPLCFVVLFKARPRDAPLIFLASLTAFWASRAGADLLGPELGASLGAFALGLVANAHARFAHRPAAVLTIPGIMLLVPGSVGLRSLSAFMEQDTAGGVATAFSMILIAVSIVAGLLLSTATLPPRQPL
ncbi:MAG: threonine/serine exporter family protein [Planctomycetota bacterium]